MIKSLRLSSLFVALALSIGQLSIAYPAVAGVLGALIAPIFGTFSATRSSCASPCAVFFDASAMTTSASTLPNFELRPLWTFGDPSSGTWGDGSTGAAGAGHNTSRNAATGTWVAHVFNPTATTVYSVSLTATNSFVSITVPSQSITVTGGDTQWPTANTYCLNASGSDFTGCRLIANGTYADSAACVVAGHCVTQADLATIISTYANAANRVQLKGGDQFAVANCTGPTLSAAGPGLIESFGTGQAKLISTYGGASAFCTLLQPSTSTDWRLVNLEWDGTDSTTPTKLNAVNIASNTTQANNILFWKNYAHDLGGFIDQSPSASQTAILDGEYLIDSTIQRLVSCGSLCSQAHGIFPHAKHLVMLGNLFDTANTNKSEHFARIGYGNQFIIAENQIQVNQDNGNTGYPGIKEAISIRAYCLVTSTDCVNNGNYFPNYGLDGSGNAIDGTTQNGQVSDNLIYSNTVGIKLVCINNNEPCALSNIQISNNTVLSTAQASFTGSIVGTTLTVSAIASGTIYKDQTIEGAGIGHNNTSISSFGTGTGGIGTYTLNRSVTVGSETMIGASLDPIDITAGASNVTVVGNLISITNSSGHNGIVIDRGRTAANPANVTVYNNSLYSNDAYPIFTLTNGTFDCVAASACPTGSIFKNNIAYAPNSTTQSMLTDWPGTAVASNNSTDTGTPTSQIKTTSPGFAVNPPGATATNWKIGGAYTTGGGVALNACAYCKDFAGASQYATPDMGAYFH